MLHRSASAACSSALTLPAVVAAAIALPAFALPSPVRAQAPKAQTEPRVDAPAQPVPASGQASAQASAAATSDPARTTEAMLRLGAVNENHQRLKSLTGKWNVVIRMWMQPGAPSQDSKGTAEIRSILDGHYVQEDFRGTAMGKPFTGLSLIGYDNVKQQYTTTWVDSLSTQTTFSEGTADPTGKVITSISHHTDPLTRKPTHTKFVVRIESDKKHVMEMFEPGPDGTEFKSMELTYARK